MPVFEERARALKAPLIHDWYVDDRMSLHLNGEIYSYPLPNLVGAHQCGNAATAIVALKSQDRFKITEEAIVRGVQSAVWPGRLERITRGPVANSLPAGWELWYDGAHNDSCGEVLGRQVAEWARANPERPLHVVTAMLRSKAPSVCLGPLLPYACSLSTFSFANGPYDQTGPAFSADDLAAVLRNDYADVVGYSSLGAAVEAVTGRFPAGRLLVTGTLYAYKELM